MGDFLWTHLLSLAGRAVAFTGQAKYICVDLASGWSREGSDFTPSHPTLFYFYQLTNEINWSYFFFLHTPGMHEEGDGFNAILNVSMYT